MKFLLIMHNNPAVWESLTEDERNAVMTGHGGFIKTIQESGEMIVTQALADPSNSAVVRVRDGVPVVTDGPYLEAKEYIASAYVLDCEDEARALAISARMPFASFRSVELWPILHESVPEM